MSYKNKLVRGALLLTAVGFLSRLMGFFYRIFLSHTFSEEAIGLYQLIFPIFALCIAGCCAGIETALSRTISRKCSEKKEKEGQHFFLLALGLSLLCSLCLLILLQIFSSQIAVYILREPRCQPLLLLLSYALPFASIHGCVCGYFFGLQKTGVPAISQLMEQLFRIGTVCLVCIILSKNGQSPSISCAVFGLISGEFIAAFFSLWHVSDFFGTRISPVVLTGFFREFLPLSLPLTANRIFLTLLQSVEAILIPVRLQLHGMSASAALSTYGVLTGMALPCILFPSAITSSISIMLTPTVAGLQSKDARHSLTHAIRKSVTFCILLGILSLLLFLVFGQFIGKMIFHSETAGRFLRTLAWICPFLYSNSTLLSILTGLGETTQTLLINSAGIFLRILSILFLVPEFGIYGYLIGLLSSQLLVCLLSFSRLYKEFR